MVFLDQDRIVETHAVIAASAAAHRVLLRRAQARNGLAGVEQGDGQAGDALAVALCGGCRARQCLQEIERRAFAAEQGAHRALDGAEGFARHHRFPVLPVPLDGDRRIEGAEGHVEPGRAADHGGFARDDRGACAQAAGEQCCGRITGAEVFGQRADDVLADFGFGGGQYLQESLHRAGG